MTKLRSSYLERQDKNRQGYVCTNDNLLLQRVKQSKPHRHDIFRNNDTSILNALPHWATRHKHG